MSTAGLRIRDKRGDWRPPELLQMPPVFVWPLQPTGFLKWLFGYPGYLWPWNSLYAISAVLTWFFLTPDLDAMKSFDVGWIAVIVARNLGLIFLVAGAWHPLAGDVDESLVKNAVLESRGQWRAVADQTGVPPGAQLGCGPEEVVPGHRSTVSNGRCG